ncbi:MAG: radical SAM protein, partial [Desulfoferrobacter sp.]
MTIIRLLRFQIEETQAVKILLIYPRTKHIRIPPPSWVPLGLSFIASVLEQRGHTVSIFDRVASQARLGLDKQKVNAAMMEHVRRFNPDLIGLNTVSPLIYDTMECVALLRRQHSGPIVAGGHHANALPELTLQKIKGLTGAIQGEGEPALLALADGQSPSQIPGLWWRNGDSISHNPPQQISNLDSLPFPAYHLLDMSFYTRSNVLTFRGRYLSSISMLTSRGCPKMCSFCSESSTYGKGVRFHSPEYVVDWVRSTLNEYPIQGIYFHDNDFLIDRQRAIEICNDFIRRGFNKRFRWAIQARSDNIDLDILELL